MNKYFINFHFFNLVNIDSRINPFNSLLHKYLYIYEFIIIFNNMNFHFKNFNIFTLKLYDYCHNQFHRFHINLNNCLFLKHLLFHILHKLFLKKK